MVDTAGTLTKAADMMMNEHGAKSVRAICTHGVLSGPAHERLKNSSLSELIITDSIKPVHDNPKIKVLTVADLFANVLTSLSTNESISSNFLIA